MSRPWGLVAGVFLVSGAASAADEREGSSPPSGFATWEGYDDWYTTAIVMPEREEAATGRHLPDGWPAAGEAAGPAELLSTTFLVGTSAEDYIIYGEIWYHNPTSPYWFDLGPGICVYVLKGFTHPCDAWKLGSFRYRQLWPAPPSYPLGVQGDPTAGPFARDRIEPADRCFGGASISCGGYYWINMTGVDPGSTYVLLGDNGSVNDGQSDVIYGWNNRDTVYASAGADWIAGEGGSDDLWGDAGADTILGEQCSVGTTEQINGGSEDDIIWGYLVDDRSGGAGCPRNIWGDDGRDTLNGGPGSDYLSGDAGDDFGLWGGPGDDWLSGYAGNEPQIHGEGGNDVLYGHGGKDGLFGGEGNDALDGGDDPEDTCDGGAPTVPPGDSCHRINCEALVSCEALWP